MPSIFLRRQFSQPFQAFDTSFIPIFEDSRGTGICLLFGAVSHFQHFITAFVGGLAIMKTRNVIGIATAKYTQNPRPPGRLVSLMLNRLETKFSGTNTNARIVNRLMFVVSA